MNTHLEDLDGLADRLATVAGDVLSSDAVRGFSQADLASFAVAVGRVLRAAEALAVDVSGEVDALSSTADREARFSTRQGCHNTSEFLQRATGALPRTVARWQKAARMVRGDVSLTTGEVRAPMLPAMRDALAAGVVGVDGVLATGEPLAEAALRCDPAGLLAADAALAETAAGVGDGALPEPADLLRVQALAWAAALDPDGAEPVEAQAARGRGITFGRLTRGLIPVRGSLLPEVAAQFQQIYDAIENPRVEPGVRFRPSTPGPCTTNAGAHDATDASAGADGGACTGLGGDAGTGAGAGDSLTAGASGLQAAGAGGLQAVDAIEHSEPCRCVLAGELCDGTCADSIVEADSRSMAQRNHDTFATALIAAVAAGALPTLGGAAPTLVVEVTESDLRTGRGWARVAGERVHLNVAAHAGCTGTIQRVTMSDTGAIISLSTEQRIFTHHQRKAIALRDGGCVIPGCGVRSPWCEVHHVTEWADGGPTHTDNGVLLCWHHHRYLENSGWQIRMNGGVPEVRPPGWIDPNRHWHPTRAHRPTTHAAAA